MAVPGFDEIAEKLRRSTVLIRAGGRGCGFSFAQGDAAAGPA